MCNNLSAFLSKFHWSVFLHSYIYCGYCSVANSKSKVCPFVPPLLSYSLIFLWRVFGASSQEYLVLPGECAASCRPSNQLQRLILATLVLPVEDGSSDCECGQRTTDKTSCCGYHLLSSSFEVLTGLQQQLSLKLPSGSELCQISVVEISSWKAVKNRT